MYISLILVYISGSISQQSFPLILIPLNNTMKYITHSSSQCRSEQMYVCMWVYGCLSVFN